MAWHTGQLTISAEDEEEEATLCRPAETAEDAEKGEEEEVAVPVAVLCCTAGDFVSLDTAESLAGVFWKKSEMLAELLLSSRSLFL